MRHLPDNDRRERFDRAVEFLRASCCGGISHSRSTLLDHLIGTHDLLARWQAPERVCLAGLCHSIFGTESFNPEVMLASRESVASAIGPQAERLTWLFGMTTAKSLWRHVTPENETGTAGTYALEDRLTGAPLACDRSELVSLLTITLANALEQVPRLRAKYDTSRAGLSKLLPYAGPAAAASFASAFGES
jgi:hypothetical protein